MALKIRLARGGSKKRPFYRIVVAEATSPRDGLFIERVGSYNPVLTSGHAERVVLNAERIKHWLSVGAQSASAGGSRGGPGGLCADQTGRNGPDRSEWAGSQGASRLAGRTDLHALPADLHGAARAGDEPVRSA